MSNLTLKELSQDWLGLTGDYRPGAFWFWNSGMEPASIEKNIAEMYQQGVREFVIHPIHGLEIEYLSETYFERVRYALNVARQYGLRVWIYDEYGWPSGNAGGKLLEKYPEHKAWFLRFTKNPDSTIHVEPVISDRILDNVVGARWTKSESGYLDTLSKQAVQAFIMLTHQRYYDECREFFDNVILGFFTDEPVTMIGCAENQREIWNAVGLPWTPELPEVFKQELGYDIGNCYDALALPGKSKVKEDYWYIVKKLHVQSYHGQIANWCKKHGIKYSGHIGENAPLMQVRFSGSAFMALGAMDEPGIDMLGCELYPAIRSLEQVLVSSIAKHAGRKRVFCEAFGVSAFDIRLGQMLKGAQMLGLYGINNIALMGFHESLDGVRKRMYWPPLFKTAPWWSFYPVFRDACARSVGLTSLGKAKARYAVLYPQHQIEQSDIFMDGFSPDDPVLVTLNNVAAAIYESGESFDFVFPENIADLTVKDGQLVLGESEYSELIVIGDFLYSQESLAELTKISQEGGTINHASCENITSSISRAVPLWKQLIDIDCQNIKNIRVYEYDYADGRLFALFNTGKQEQAICIRSDQYLTQWHPETGKCVSRHGNLEFVIESESIKYFSVSSHLLAKESAKNNETCVPIDTKWSIHTNNLNTARLFKVQFYHEKSGWLDPEIVPSEASISALFIPSVFKGQTSIKMRGEFYCDDIPAKLGVVYEQMHFADLSLNERTVELKHSKPFKGWDASCRYIEVADFCRKGCNVVEGVLQFEKFETTLFSHGFFTERPVMPTCDICLAGTFKLIDGRVVQDDNEEIELPVNLAEAGWPHYSGKVSLACEIDVAQTLSEKIRGLAVALVSEDSVELILDGNSIGYRIIYPYKFELDSVTTGRHKLELVISTTSGNISDEPSPSGLLKVEWLC